MLLSMTGFGEARCQRDGLAVAVEIRTINSRFFKLSVRAGEWYASLEPEIEAVVRNRIRRGTIQVAVRVDRARSADQYRINADVIERYRRQLDLLYRQWDLPGTVAPESLLSLPGVVDEDLGKLANPSDDWPLIAETIEAAIESLSQMRADEGRTMADDLRANCRAAAASLAEIRKRAPQVANDYRHRLEERLKRILAEYDVALEPAALVREVSLFAERGDVSEEMVRLQSHLDQFEATLDQPESQGRRLDFLTQEMLRETNTIGSKANDVEIAGHVIEIKTAIERIREMVQNVE